MGLRVQTWISVLILAGAGMYAYHSLTGPSGVAALRRQRETIERLRHDNEKLRADNERRRKRNDSLKRDKDTLDQHLRERYDLGLPGEKKFKYPDSVVPPAGPAGQPEAH